MAWNVGVTKRWKDLQADQKRTRRARLKGWRLRAPNHLSAHLFFGALCEGLWRTSLAEPPMHAEVSGAPACFGSYGGV